MLFECSITMVCKLRLECLPQCCQITSNHVRSIIPLFLIMRPLFLLTSRYRFLPLQFSFNFTFFMDSKSMQFSSFLFLLFKFIFYALFNRFTIKIVTINFFYSLCLILIKIYNSTYLQLKIVRLYTTDMM